MRRILILAVAVLVAAPVARVGADEPAIAIEVAAGVPFSASDLEAAVALRSAEPPPLIEVAPAATSGAVVVTVGDNSRSVDLGALSGAAAARRVAVISLDLFRQTEAPAELVAETSAVAEVSAPVVPPTLTAASAVANRGYPAWFAFTGLVGYGNTGIAWRNSVRATIGRTALLWVFSIGGDKWRSDDGLSFDDSAVSGGLGWHWRTGSVSVDGCAKLVVTRHSIGVDDGEERLEDSAMRPGSALELKVFLPIFTTFALVAGGEVTGYLTSQRYVVGGDEVYSTDRIGVAAAVGLAWFPARSDLFRGWR